MSQIDLLRSNYSSIQQITDQYLNSGVSKPADAADISFKELLENKLRQGIYETPGSESLKFSKHALNRLSDREIELSDEIKGRLLDGVDKAKGKGIQDSLVIVDSLSFIVNVPNRTVVTAMDNEANEENIFTNIDGAVIA